MVHDDPLRDPLSSKGVIRPDQVAHYAQRTRDDERSIAGEVWDLRRLIW